MSQQDNFSSGFLWGAVLGGIAGGIAGGLIGTVLANQSGDPDAEVNDDSDIRTNLQMESSPAKARRRPLRLESAPQKNAPQKNMELARQSLEDKIASLNDAIDDVRQQLHQVNAEEVRSPRSGGDDVAMGRGDRSTAKPNGDSPSGETS